MKIPCIKNDIKNKKEKENIILDRNNIRICHSSSHRCQSSFGSISSAWESVIPIPCPVRYVASYTHAYSHTYTTRLFCLSARVVRASVENQLCESIGRGFDFSLSHRCCGLISSHVTRFIQRIYRGTFVTLISTQFRRVYIYIYIRGYEIKR